MRSASVKIQCIVNNMLILCLILRVTYCYGKCNKLIIQLLLAPCQSPVMSQVGAEEKVGFHVLVREETTYSHSLM